MDWRRVRLAAVMKLSITTNLVEVLLIIHRSTDHFARICDGAEKLYLRDGKLWRCRSYGSRALRDSIEVGNEHIVGRQRISICRQNIKCSRHIADHGVFDET